MLGRVCVTKIGNVLFYKVYRDCWLTQDGEYGIFRAYCSKSRKECVIAKNEKPIDLDTVNFPAVFPVFEFLHILRIQTAQLLRQRRRAA